ncbi:hypothetical protein MKW94_003168, partial [Papaver nudicaule]|nr:hypothetical protein [Papaver nudicaule]MCL7031666.1 hypothetical protein [Papaver nudicaule]
MNTRDPPNYARRSFFEDQSAVPARPCPCGGGTCIVRTSRTPKNPNKEFYTCPGKKDMRCKFFQWCIDAKPEDFNEPLSKYPMCHCGAGVCHRYPERREGADNGRLYFRCPVKPGEGACGFRQWQETPTRALHSDLVDDSRRFPTLAYGGREDTKRANGEYRMGDGDKLKEIVSPVFITKRQVRVTIGPLVRVSQVKADTIRLDSMTYGKIISPMGKLKLSDEKLTPTGHCSS